MFNITIGGNAESVLQRRIDQLSPTSIMTALEAAGRAAGVAAESFVSPYPEQTGNPLPKIYSRTNAQGQEYLSKFKSLRQQKLVLSLGARGLLPYRRTGQLGRSITSDIQSLSPDGVTVLVGSNLSYSPYVIDKYRQAAYHRGNWTPIQDDIERGLPQIAAQANAAFIRVLLK